MSSPQKFINLNKYTIISQIGGGSFSKIYRVRDLSNSQMYAAKMSILMIDNDTKNSKEALFFFREINIMSFINHPSIIKFIGYSPNNFENDPLPTIIMELATNGSLRDLINMEIKGLTTYRYDDTQKLIILYGISSGMAYLHAHNILHRDLSPENILVDDDLNPKISGFVLSKITDFISASMNRNSQKSLKGTPLYIAPEVLSNYEYSKAGDVYAFAYIMYEILSLEKPFKEFNFLQLMEKVVNEESRPTISSNIPPAYRELIERCWSQNPENRPSFEEIVNEFKNNPDFITDLVDESRFFDYIDYIDNYRITFNPSELIHFDEFINGKPETNQGISSSSKSTENVKPVTKCDEKVRDKDDTKESPSSEISPKSLFFDTSNFEPTNKKLSDNGGSFETLIVKNRSNSNEYVAKIITNGLENPQDQQKLIKTSEILFDLNHPSISSLQGINFHSIKDIKTLKPTILTEYYSNGSLRTIFDRIKNKKSVKNWDPTKKLIFLLGISHGMKTLHSKGLVHSNLKPENILIDKNFYPKISDIKISSEGKVNVTFCTSPELFKNATSSKGEEVGSEADVYAFAMIAYEVISGNGPFSKNGKSFKISHLEKKILSKERPDLSSKSITSSMRDLISAS